MGKVNNIVIENAKIQFRNFGGLEGKFNPKGNRNFCVFLEHESALELEADGWNIKWLDPIDVADDRQGYIQVAVAYSNIPPKIVLISGQGKTVLDESTVDMLDWAELDTVDIIIRPYEWEVNGKAGIKAYVKSLYVTIVEDEFANKYYDIPDNAMSSVCDPSKGEC